MTEPGGQWLNRIRGEIDRARHELEAEHGRLREERSKLEQQIAALERELGVLNRLDSQSTATGTSRPAKPMPLSQRVLELLQTSQSELTSRELRERLHLDHRETRNLGPVLNQLARSGKLVSPTRGAPWRLAL